MHQPMNRRSARNLCSLALVIGVSSQVAQAQTRSEAGLPLLETAIGQPCTVHGFLVDEAGEPVAGARAWFIPDEPTLRAMDEFDSVLTEFRVDAELRKRLPSVESDPKGSFTLPGRVVARRSASTTWDRPNALVLIDHPALALGVMRAEGLVAGGSVELGTIELSPASIVRGRAVDEAGAPLPGVEAWPESYDFPWSTPPFRWSGNELSIHSSWIAGRSDVDGQFEIRQLAGGPSSLQLLSLRAPSRKVLELRDLDLPPGGILDLGDLTIARGLLIEGEVLDSAGQLIAGAHISLLSLMEMPCLDWFWDCPICIDHARSSALPSTTTGPDGRFRIGGLESSNVWVHADADGYEPAWLCDQLPGAHPVTIQLAPERTLRLRVVDAITGERLVAARVRAERTDGATIPVETVNAGEDDVHAITHVVHKVARLFAARDQAERADGTTDPLETVNTGEDDVRPVSKAILIQQTRLRVFAAGHGSAALHVPASLPDASESLLIALEPDVPLDGQVVDAMGRPVPGVGLWAEATGVVYPSPELEWETAPVTDLEGKFTLRGLGPGTWEVGIYENGSTEDRKHVKLEAGVRPSPLTLVTARNTPAGKLDISLPPLATFVGHVGSLDATEHGEAVALVWPSDRPADRGDGLGRRVVRCEADGTFRAKLPAGEWRLAGAVVGDYPRFSGVETIVIGSAPFPPILGPLELSCGGNRFALRLAEEGSGLPVSDVTVYVERDVAWDGAIGLGEQLALRPDASGRLVFETVEPEADVNIVTPWYEGITRHVSAVAIGDETTITLPARRSVLVHVRLPNGAPVRASTRFEFDGSLVPRAIEADGNVRCLGIEPGRHELRILAPLIYPNDPASSTTLTATREVVIGTDDVTIDVELSPPDG